MHHHHKMPQNCLQNSPPPPPPPNTQEPQVNQPTQSNITLEKKGPDKIVDHNKKDETQHRPLPTSQKQQTTHSRTPTIDQATGSMERKDTPGLDGRRYKQTKHKNQKPQKSNKRNISVEETGEPKKKPQQKTPEQNLPLNQKNSYHKLKEDTQGGSL